MVPPPLVSRSTVRLVTTISAPRDAVARLRSALGHEVRAVKSARERPLLLRRLAAADERLAAPIPLFALELAAARRNADVEPEQFDAAAVRLVRRPLELGFVVA